MGDQLLVPRELLESLFKGTATQSTLAFNNLLALLAQPASEPKPAAGEWREGSPPHPWDSEWFLAEMREGAFVVLRPLPEGYTYDFTTADGTYFMRQSIIKWAQLSGSDYIAPEAHPAPAGVVLPEREELERERSQPNSWDDYAMGWNDCLDEVERLNK